MYSALRILEFIQVTLEIIFLRDLKSRLHAIRVNTGQIEFAIPVLEHGHFLDPIHEVKCNTRKILKSLRKVKCTLVEALRLCTGRTAYRRSRRIALPFFDHGTRSG
jgi:hypothetical protein